MKCVIFFKIKQYRKFSRPEKLFFATFLCSGKQISTKMNLNEVCSQHVVGVHLILVKLFILIRRAGYGRGEDFRKVVFSTLQAYNINKKKELIKEFR